MSRSLCSRAREVVRLLAAGRLVMEQDDLELVGLADLPQIQQQMLDGRMSKPKGAALVQASRPGRTVAECETAYLGEPLASGVLNVSWCDGVAIVAMNRPAALNALSANLLAHLDQLVGEVEGAGTVHGRPVEAILLTGAGRAFMAGADVTGFVGRTEGEIAALAAQVLGVYGRLENLRLPAVSLIDGFALGGGNELAMSTHYRIVTENAQLGQPEIKLGIIPGYGGMQRLPRLGGRALQPNSRSTVSRSMAAPRSTWAWPTRFVPRARPYALPFALRGSWRGAMPRAMRLPRWPPGIRRALRMGWRTTRGCLGRWPRPHPAKRGWASSWQRTRASLRS